MRIIGTAAVLVASVLGGCGHRASGIDGGVRLGCTGSVVAVVGDEQLGCDVQPGQRLDVLDVSPQACDDMGGISRPDTDAAVGNVDCEGVDF